MPDIYDSLQIKVAGKRLREDELADLLLEEEIRKIDFRKLKVDDAIERTEKNLLSKSDMTEE